MRRTYRVGRPNAAGGSGKSVLTSSNFQEIGVFKIRPYGDPNWSLTLALRSVGGQQYLYAAGLDSKVQEFAIPADNALGQIDLAGNITASIPIATLTNTFGDIFQDAIAAPGGCQYPVNPGNTGLAGGLGAQALFGRPGTNDVWWIWFCYYTSDGTVWPVMGNSTLDDSAHTGTGNGMWKALASPFGNRWCSGFATLPDDFLAECQLSVTKNLALGFGGARSIVSNQTSMGPTLVAFDPASFTAGNNLDFPSIAGTVLIGFPISSGVSAARPAFAYARDNVWGTNGQVFGPNDGLNVGGWFETSTQRGLAIWSLLGGGNADTTIAASPAPTTNSCTLADATNVRLNDLAFFETVITDAAVDYKFAQAYVTGKSGNDITLGTIFQSGNDGLDMTGVTPKVGGYFRCDIRYTGGGNGNSNFWPVLTIIDPLDLAKVARGELAASAVPLVSTQFPLMTNFVSQVGGIPIPGTTLQQTFNGAGLGIMSSNYLSSAQYGNRWYIQTLASHKNGSSSEPLVHVIQVT